MKHFFETVEKEFDINFEVYTKCIQPYTDKTLQDLIKEFVKQKIKEGIIKTIKNIRMQILNMSRYNKTCGKVCRILQEKLDELEDLFMKKCNGIYDSGKCKILIKNYKEFCEDGRYITCHYYQKRKCKLNLKRNKGVLCKS